jgi:hypothetical protein
MQKLDIHGKPIHSSVPSGDPNGIPALPQLQHLFGRYGRQDLITLSYPSHLEAHYHPSDLTYNLEGTGETPEEIIPARKWSNSDLAPEAKPFVPLAYQSSPPFSSSMSPLGGADLLSRRISPKAVASDQLFFSMEIGHSTSGANNPISLGHPALPPPLLGLSPPAVAYNPRRESSSNTAFPSVPPSHRVTYSTTAPIPSRPIPHHTYHHPEYGSAYYHLAHPSAPCSSSSGFGIYDLTLDSPFSRSSDSNLSDLSCSPLDDIILSEMNPTGTFAFDEF